jgi:hypothetical protein
MRALGSRHWVHGCIQLHAWPRPGLGFERNYRSGFSGSFRSPHHHIVLSFDVPSLFLPKNIGDPSLGDAYFFSFDSRQDGGLNFLLKECV